MEIQNQLKPLVETVTKQGQVIRSLYSNGSGGPPGYLETARAEDKERIGRLFVKIDKVAERLDVVDSFIGKHNAREEQRDKDRAEDAVNLALTVKASDLRFRRYIAAWGLIIALLTALMQLWGHWPAIKRSLLAPDVVGQQMTPQTSINPDTR